MCLIARVPFSPGGGGRSPACRTGVPPKRPCRGAQGQRRRRRRSRRRTCPTRRGRWRTRAARCSGGCWASARSVEEDTHAAHHHTPGIFDRPSPPEGGSGRAVNDGVGSPALVVGPAQPTTVALRHGAGEEPLRLTAANGGAAHDDPPGNARVCGAGTLKAHPATGTALRAAGENRRLPRCRRGRLRSVERPLRVGGCDAGQVRGQRRLLHEAPARLRHRHGELRPGA